MSERARAFADLLHRWSGLDVVLVDERLSSRAAVERTGRSRSGRRDDPSHAAAACIIAETWLNSAP